MVFLIVFIIIILNNILFFDTIYDKSRDLAIAQLKLNRYTLSTEDGEQQATWNSNKEQLKESNSPEFSLKK